MKKKNTKQQRVWIVDLFKHVGAFVVVFDYIHNIVRDHEYPHIGVPTPPAGGGGGPLGVRWVHLYEAASLVLGW